MGELRSAVSRAGRSPLVRSFLPLVLLVLAVSCRSGGPQLDTPEAQAVVAFKDRVTEYVALHDYFGRGTNEVMHRLRSLRNRVRAAGPGGGDSQQ